MAEIKTVLTAPKIRGLAVCDGGGYQDDKTSDWEFSDKGLQKLAHAIEAAVLSANAGKVDIKDGEIERLRQMVNDLRDDACDCDACSAARDYMASVESTAQQASDAGKV